MAFHPDFSGRYEIPHTVRIKAPDSKGNVIWQEVNVRPNPGKQATNAKNIYSSHQGRNWRRQDKIIQEYQRTGFYETGSALKMETSRTYSPSGLRQENAVMRAFQIALEKKER